MTYSNEIAKLLKIKDSNITFPKGFIENEKIIKNNIHFNVISAKLSYVAACCEKCSVDNIDFSIHKHGYKTCYINCTESNENHRLLKLKKQRFKCFACDATFIAKTT